MINIKFSFERNPNRCTCKSRDNKITVFGLLIVCGLPAVLSALAPSLCLLVLRAHTEPMNMDRVRLKETFQSLRKKLRSSSAMKLQFIRDNCALVMDYSDVYGPLQPVAHEPGTNGRSVGSSNSLNCV